MEKEKKHTAGQETRTEDKYFIDIVGLGLEALWSFFDVVWTMGEYRKDQNLCKIGLIGQTLVSDVKMKATEFDRFAQKHCGSIVIESMRVGSDDAADDAWVNARFDPSKPKANVVELKGANRQ